VVSVGNVVAQESAATKHSGEIIYEQKIKLDIQLEGDAAQFMAALPKERKSKKLLLFNHEASLYQNSKEVDDEAAMQMSDGGAVQIKMSEPDDKVFCELKTGKQIEQKEFMSRIFLVEKEIPREQWKMNGEVKEILGYSCNGAEMQKGEKFVKAWFSPEIPVSSGPASFVNLPGMVLGVDINEGEVKIEALSVEMKDVDEGDLKKPKKGKKLSEEEFQAVVDEKMKEMGMEAGEGKAVQTFVIKMER
jgi:GLPGLI family protein